MNTYAGIFRFRPRRISYYHNRGNSTFTGESSTFGDFSGLDDLMTENPRVVQGFIEIYGTWIDTYGIDGSVSTPRSTSIRSSGKPSCRQIVRSYGRAPGLFAVSRMDPDTGREVLIVFNTSAAPFSAQVAVNTASQGFVSLHGQCESAAAVPGSYRVSVAALEYIVCASGDGG